MQVDFDEIGLQLDAHNPAVTYGSFSGVADFDWDDAFGQPYVFSIKLDAFSTNHRVELGRSSTLFFQLSDALLRAYADKLSDHFADKAREFDDADCGYGHLQQELV